MKVQILLLVVLLALVSPGYSQASHFCGRVLAETLVKYCRFSTVEDGAMGKRSDSWTRTQLFGAGYWLTPHQAMGMGRGKRQGIATQCCENSCTISELLEYCPQ